MRKLISFFIKYHVSVNIIILAFIIFGWVGLSTMKSSFFPLVPSELIDISVTYPGAAPNEIEEGIVLKIEDNLKGLVGIDRFTSVSRENTASIRVEIIKGYDIDVVLQNVKNAVDKVPSFPVGMEPPVVAKIDNIQEAISFVVSGKGVSLKSLKDIARDIETDLRGIDGISQIELSGFPDEEIEIAVQEEKLRAYDLTFSDVASAVSSANILVTGGSIKTEKEEYLIRANNRFYYGDELDFIVVKADKSGNEVRLRDVAVVHDKWSETPDRSFFDGNPSIRIKVSSTENEDLIKNARSTRDYIENYNKTHDNIRLDITRDSSITLIQRTELLIKNGGMGMLLVFIFLALFLKPRLAFWVAAGLPIAFLGMFIFVSYFNVTINVLSLFGMIIVIGILVDDGIVISENIYHHYESGKSRIRAAIDGTMEVIPPILSAILTTVVAFSTFFFLDGRIGSFFGEVSAVVILTLTLSLVEALIILPAHMAHSKALTKDQKVYAFNKRADQLMAWMRDKLYVPTLTFFIKYRFLGFAIPVAALMITFGAIRGGIIRTTFFPTIASDRVSITLKMPQGTNESITEDLIVKIEAAAWEVNEVFSQELAGDKSLFKNIVRRIGPGTSTASLTINLLPGEERGDDFPAYRVSNAIEKQVGELYGVESVEYGSGNVFGGKPVSVSLTGRNIPELKAAKEELRKGFLSDKRLINIADNDPDGIKEVRIKMKEKAYLLGLSLNDIMSQVRGGFFGRQVQRFQRGQDEIKVWVRYTKQERSSLDNLDKMRIRTKDGNRIPITELVDYTIERGEVAINHLDAKREIRVDADLADQKGSATGVLEDIKKNVLKDILDRHPSVSPLYEGQNREAGKVLSSAKVVIPVVLFLIYAIIAFTFRSYSQPLLLLMMIPFSLIAVAWGHWIHGFAINVLSFLGIIALIGIIVNDGLVLIEKYNSFLKGGMKLEEAIIAAGKSRFRAIFLTSITTIAGLAPLMIEKSLQAQFLKPMAISIAYGIGLATLLTLILLPMLMMLTNTIKVYVDWGILYLKNDFRAVPKPIEENQERAIKELAIENEDF